MKEMLLSPLPLSEFEMLVENSLRRVFVENFHASAPPEIIGRMELCKRLAVTEPTVIRWEKRGKIPCFHIGSSVRYNWPSVLESLEKK